MNKEKDWVFSLERQIVNNLKQQITNLDVNNILHYHQTGEIREVSYVPIVSNSLVYLWNEIEERVANSFFSNGLDLAEFNDNDIRRLEDLIRYLEEEKNLETDKKKKLFKEVEIKKYKQQLSTIRGETVSIKSSSKKLPEITDPIEYDTLEKRLKRGDVSSSEKAQIKRQLKAYDDKMDKLLLETEDSEALEAQKTQDIKQAKEAKKGRIEDNKKQYTLEELKAIQKAQATKGKTFSTAFSVSPFMKTRINNLSKILDTNIKETEESKDDKIKKYKRIVRLVNTEVKEKNYSLKQALEKEMSIETNVNEDRKKRLKRLLTGNIREEAFVKQIEKLMNQKSFNFEKLEGIYRSQLRNPDLTKKQKETISDLLADLSREDKRNQISTIFSNIKELGSREKKIERIIVTEMTAAYNIATFLSNPNAKYFKWSIEPEHERRNAVCLVCYERANGGYLNKGVYPKEQIEVNVELFIPKHPYCLCRYIPITKDTNPDLFALIEGMSPEQKQGYEQAMDNWVNLSNNWSKLGTVTKGAALTALSVASLWLAAKRFKKLGEVIEKGSKGFIKLRDRFMGEGDIGRSPQQVVNAITREGGILPQRPQYGLGEIAQINPQNVEAVIQDTNEGTRLLAEAVEQEKPQILKTVLSSVGAGVKVADLPNEVLESMEVAELLAVDKAERNYMTAPLDVEIEGVKPEHQDFPLEELAPNKGTDYLSLKYDYPTLNSLALQAVNQFERNHSKEIIELGDILQTLRGYNVEEIVDEGVLNGYIEDLIKAQKKINSLIRELPNEVLSSKNARDNNRKMTFYLEGNDVKFPFKGKGQINKAIGFVAEIEKGEKSGIIGQNTVSNLVETVEELKALRTQAENRKLRILETEGTRDLQNEKVFYDPETLTLKKAENVEPLPPTTLTREAFVDNVLLVGETFNYLGVKREDKELLNFLEDLYSANKYVKTVQSLDKQKYSVKQIKEYLVSQPDLPVNIGSKFNSIEANSQKILKYIASEKIGLETQIKELESLLNSVSIKVKDKVDIKESDIKEQIQIALNKLRLRQSFLTTKADIIKDFNKLKDSLVNDQASYMNRKYRLSELETLDENLKPVQKTFRTTQLKITDLKKKIADLITEQQTLTDRKKIDEIENKIKVLTEEIRKVQIAEFRRYEVEKNNNYIQYLSVRDNVLFSRIFREKLKR